MVLEEFKIYLKKKNSNISDKTIQMYCNTITNYFKFAETKYKNKNKNIYIITKRMFKRYKIELKNRGYALKTINSKIRIFIMYEKFLIESNKKQHEVLNKDLLYKKERKNIKNISNESYERIIEMAKKDNRKYYLMLILYVKYKISLRNLVKIEVNKDIDFNNKKIYIREKEISIDNELERAIKIYLKDRKKFLKGYDNKYLFVSHIGKSTGKPMDKTSVSMAIKIYYEKLIKLEDYYGDWSDLY